jgi:hypothetical protein
MAEMLPIIGSSGRKVKFAVKFAGIFAVGKALADRCRCAQLHKFPGLSKRRHHYFPDLFRNADYARYAFVIVFEPSKAHCSLTGKSTRRLRMIFGFIAH